MPMKSGKSSPTTRTGWSSSTKDKDGSISALVPCRRETDWFQVGIVNLGCVSGPGRKGFNAEDAEIRKETQRFLIFSLRPSATLCVLWVQADAQPQNRESRRGHR